MDRELNKAQRDALKELVSIGAGNAATALSQMIKKKVKILVPRVNFTTIDKVPEIFGGAETLVTAIYLQALGDVAGVMLFSFRKEEGNKLADLILGNLPGKTKLLNDMSSSALKETASILSGAYVNALAKLLKKRLLISSPAISQDMAGALVGDILIETGKDADYAIVIDTELEIVDEKVMAYFFFIPETGSLEKVLSELGVE